jgi:CRISPR/Cas system-associated exonuclease Cas4 (RecB family)
VDIRKYFHGMVVDTVMRTFLLSGPAPGERRGQMAVAVRAAVEFEEERAKAKGDGVVRWRSAADKKDLIEWCAELVTRLEPILDEHVLPFEYQPAHRFRAPVLVPGLRGEQRQILTLGEIDVLVRDREGKFRLWDLKGTSDDQYWRKTVGQLIFYDLAVAAQFGASPIVAGLIQPMCEQRVMPINITEPDREVLFSRVISMVQGIWRADFPYAVDAETCQWCEVRWACPKFDPVRAFG